MIYGFWSKWIALLKPCVTQYFISASILTAAIVYIGIFTFCLGTVKSISPVNNEDSKASVTPAATITPIIKISAPVSKLPYPTVKPGTLSDERLSWYYIPGGGEGKPATNSGSLISMCARFNGIWQGDKSVKKVYITLNIGFEYNNNTTRILDIAKNKNIKLNFFVVCNLFANKNLRTMFLRMYNEGHFIGNHSWNHPMYDEMLVKYGADAVANDLKKGEDAFFALTGVKMLKYMRFPSGVYSEASMALMSELGYTAVFWSFAYKDWLVDDQPDPEESLQKMIKSLHNGAILYLHTVSDTNVEILPELIDEIHARGYQTGLINEIKNK